MRTASFALIAPVALALVLSGCATNLAGRKQLMLVSESIGHRAVEAGLRADHEQAQPRRASW